MAAMAAILKFFKRHLLPSGKSETWWEALQWHKDCIKHSVLISKMAAAVAILKFFKRHLLQIHKSYWAEIWWKASVRHRESELLNSFRSDIQDGRHGCHLEILLTISPPKPYVPLSQNLTGGIGASQRFRMLKSFRSDIQDSRHGGHLELLQTTSSPKP